MSEKLTASIGRTVLFVLSSSVPGLRADAVGQIRPATVVRTWGENGGPSSCVNLLVHLDGDNDRAGEQPRHAWLTSVDHSKEKRPHTWHFPQYDPTPEIPPTPPSV